MLALRAFDEVLAHAFQHRGLLLAHGAAHNIRLAEREAGQRGGDLHNLLLIQDNAVGILQNGLHQRMEHLSSALAVAASNEVFGHARAQRARAVEGDERNQILEARWRKVHNKLRDACGFQLEDTGGVAFAQHGAGCFVLKRYIINIHHFTGGLFNKFNAVADNGQGTQAQKVHF